MHDVFIYFLYIYFSFETIFLFDKRKDLNNHNKKGTRADAHHGPALEHLAADGARADEEVAEVAELLVEGVAENSDLRIKIKNREWMNNNKVR